MLFAKAVICPRLHAPLLCHRRYLGCTLSVLFFPLQPTLFLTRLAVGMRVQSGEFVCREEARKQPLTQRHKRNDEKGHGEAVRALVDDPAECEQS